MCKHCRLLVLLFSAKEALKGAEERQKELEEEAARVTQQMEEEIDKVVKQKEEEIKRMRNGLEEHQERQLAEAKAKEENAKYASNSLSVFSEVIVTFPPFLCFIFP